MVCHHKMLAKRDKKSGNVIFVGSVEKFTPQDIKAMAQTSPNYDFIKLPCGRCIGCRLAKSREWAVRIMHENLTSKCSCFITLTFDKQKIYDWYYNVKRVGHKKSQDYSSMLIWTLDVKTFQDFMKRLRKEVPSKVRFFHTGEYGSLKNRPHHHCILFGYDFPDKKVRSYKKLGNKRIVYYVSDLLSKLWPFGYHIITDVTEDSACYCARYVTKKINGDLSDEHYHGRKKEYITMSRNHGIGYDWFKFFGHTDCFPQDFLLTEKKHKIKPPRYYDHLYDLTCPEEFFLIKKDRENLSRKFMLDLNDLSHYDETPDRVKQLDEADKRILDKLIRCFDDANSSDSDFIEFQNKCAAFGISDEFVGKAISSAKEFENELYSAKKIAFDYLASIYGDLNYKELENVKN